MSRLAEKELSVLCSAVAWFRGRYMITGDNEKASSRDEGGVVGKVEEEEWVWLSEHMPIVRKVPGSIHDSSCSRVPSVGPPYIYRASYVKLEVKGNEGRD